MMFKPIKIHGAPLLDENFKPVTMTRSQAEKLAKRKARQMEMKGKAYIGAEGHVYESDTHLCINVGWKVKDLR
ncbi:MAG: hypothetical protein ACRCUU_12485 [Plesiomonas sp.]